MRTLVFVSALMLSTTVISDEMNLTTGEYIMDMGSGDKMNTTTGEYFMDMGGGDSMNTTTGEYIMDMD